jgi:hypothetical protein
MLQSTREQHVLDSFAARRVGAAAGKKRKQLCKDSLYMRRNAAALKAFWRTLQRKDQKSQQAKG